MKEKKLLWSGRWSGIWVVKENGKYHACKDKWDGNNVLLFGSEGYGLKYQTKKNSDFLLRININKNVESLNISNSASIIFHHLHQIKKIKS